MDCSWAIVGVRSADGGMRVIDTGASLSIPVGEATLMQTTSTTESSADKAHLNIRKHSWKGTLKLHCQGIVKLEQVFDEVFGSSSSILLNSS